MKRPEILDTAKQYVTKDRAADHGDMENNFRTIAEYWSTHLGMAVTPDDVAVMMTLLKLARIKSNRKHLDNWIDGAGYLACGGEIASETT
jgi:ribosomal protein L20